MEYFIVTEETEGNYSNWSVSRGKKIWNIL